MSNQTSKQTLREESAKVQSHIDAVRAKLIEVNRQLRALMDSNTDDSAEGEILSGMAAGLDLRLNRLFQRLDDVNTELFADVESDR